MFLPQLHFLVRSGPDYFQLVSALPVKNLLDNVAILEFLDESGVALGPVLIYEHISWPSSKDRLVSGDASASLALYTHAISVLHVDAAIALDWKKIRVSFRGKNFGDAIRWKDRTFMRGEDPEKES